MTVMTETHIKNTHYNNGNNRNNDRNTFKNRHYNNVNDNNDRKTYKQHLLIMTIIAISIETHI